MRWQGRRESDNVEIDVDNQARRLAAAGRRLPSAEREGRHCIADYCAGGGLLRRGFDRHVDRRTDAAAADLHAALHQPERR